MNTSIGVYNVKRKLIYMKVKKCENKAGYAATLVACGWAGTVTEKVSGAFLQE